MVSFEKARSALLTISLIIVAVGVLAWFYVTGENGGAIKDDYSGNLKVINFTTLEAKDDGYLMCAKKYCRDDGSQAKAKIYNAPRMKLSQALFIYTDNNPMIATFRSDLSSWQFDFTEKMPTEKFPHVVTVQFIELSENQSTLNIYSRSELKASDVEIHKNRVEKWLRFMESSLNK